MAETTLMDTGSPAAQPKGLDGFVSDWTSDQRTFKNVPWGKAMMWIFLLSDTFIFSCFLLSYMTVRMSTTVPWPNPSEYAPGWTPEDIQELTEARLIIAEDLREFRFRD